ncbi:MAG: uroporphyrinogen-III C-methyltransferase [Hyphomicrobiaceae bacterium]|nr:uroporphyrinogen-III C-methyltransferase [Hyphomicrobiaceae bacterium]
MEQLPICLNLKGRSVVVSGNGRQAVRRACTAMRAGAKVLVVADRRSDALDEVAQQHGIEIRTGEVSADDLKGAMLVFAASEDRASNARVCELARAHGVLISSENSESCDFTMPSIIDRSPLLVAISSAGTSPLLVRLIAQRLEASIPAAFGKLTRFLGRARESISRRIPERRARRHFIETLVDGPVSDLVLAGDEARAQVLLERETERYVASGVPEIGEVYLVGGGPGDPDLLTFRALRLMQRADVVVYDRLLGSAIMDLVRPNAERIYVGKKRNEHALPQEEISKLLVRLAREGKRVLRLKGGDPFIFGRGGEEIELLAAEGVPFQIVPGITAASGCASFAGIPLTHRDHAQACVFVTGHTKTGRLSAEWVSLLQPGQTVVVYMGLAYLAELTADFIAHGADASLPVAIIENGTRPNQKVATGSLANIAEVARAEGVVGPALIIIGSVVSLRDKLAWFNPPPTSDAAATAAFGAPADSSGAVAASATSNGQGKHP